MSKIIITHGRERTRELRSTAGRLLSTTESIEFLLPGSTAKWQSAQSLEQEAKTLGTSLRTLQRKVEQGETLISFIGCNIGKSRETLTAVGRFFGGSGITVNAPKTGASLVEGQKVLRCITD